MKKHLLLGSALFAAISAFPQQGRSPSLASGFVNEGKKIAERFASENVQSQTAISTNNVPTTEEEQSQTPSASKTESFVTTWTPFTGSMNAFGVALSQTRPLQYNEDLNSVTFVHRKSQSYQASPIPASTAESGVIVSMVSQDWGATWDSTCVWNDNTNWARYPQGGVYNPQGNVCIDSAFVVGTAAITSASSNWTGNAFFSKRLGSANYNNMASTVTNAMQFIPTLSAGLGKADFTTGDFQVTDDGKIHTLGYVDNDPNSATNIGYRGARVVTGTFNSGVFTWSGDSIIPVVTTDGTGLRI